MSDEISITVSGVEETLAGLSAMPASLAKNAFGKALTAATVPVIEALDSQIPVALKAGGREGEIGSLKAALMTDIAIDAQGKGGVAQVGFGRLGFVARMVELGHRMIGHKPNKKDTGKVVSPHPFMGPVAASSAEASIAAFADSICVSMDDGSVGNKVA